MRKITALIAITLALILCSTFAEAQSATAFKNAARPVKMVPPPKPYIPPPTIKQAVTKAPAPKPAAPVGQNLNNLPKKPAPVKAAPPKKTVQDSLRVERAARNEPAIKPAIPKAASATKSGQPGANMSEAFKARASVSRLKRMNSTKLTGKAKSELGAAIHKSEQIAETTVKKNNKLVSSGSAKKTPKLTASTKKIDGSSIKIPDKRKFRPTAMKKRGWDEQSVRNTVSNPYTTRKSLNKQNGNTPATAYYNKDTSYVVVDDTSKNLVQISDRTKPDWKPDPNIVNPYRGSP